MLTFASIFRTELRTDVNMLLLSLAVLFKSMGVKETSHCDVFYNVIEIIYHDMKIHRDRC